VKGELPVQRGGRLSYRVFGATVVLAALACCVAVGVFVTRTSSAAESPAVGASHAQRQHTAVSVEQSRAALLGGLTFAPATGATAVAPDAPVVVKAGIGTLADVSVTASTGAKVAGEFSLTAAVWTSTAPGRTSSPLASTTSPAPAAIYDVETGT